MNSNISEDIENVIPVNNLHYSQGSSELRVKTITQNEEGFTATVIERLKVQNHQSRQICVTRPFQRWHPICNTISLSVEDAKRAVKCDDCWKVHDVKFRRVLVYGKVDVLNHFSRDKRTCYKLSVDDGSDVLVGTMNINKDSKTKVAAMTGRLTLERNKVRQTKDVGINIKGVFHPPESQEYNEIISSIAKVHSAVGRNIKHHKKEFSLGPALKKALIFASLYATNDKQIQLHIIDLTFNDDIELAWKQQLNKLYLKEYLKKP